MFLCWYNITFINRLLFTWKSTSTTYESPHIRFCWLFWVVARTWLSLFKYKTIEFVQDQVYWSKNCENRGLDYRVFLPFRFIWLIKLILRCEWYFISDKEEDPYIERVVCSYSDVKIEWLFFQRNLSFRFRRWYSSTLDPILIFVGLRVKMLI